MDVTQGDEISQLMGVPPGVEPNPLGLTPDQIRQAEVDAVADEVREAWRRFMERIQANLEAFDALPAGTMIRCGNEWCTELHPIEMYR